MIMSYSEAFVLIADLAQKRGHQTIRDSILRLEIDEHWSLALNGFSEERDLIPPYHCRVECNGMPAGILGAQGGTMVGGVENEDRLIAALKAAGATT